MEFSRPEYWSGLPFPSPGDLSDPGIKPGFPALQADSLPSKPPGKPQSIINEAGSHSQVKPPVLVMFLVHPGEVPCVPKRLRVLL